MTELDERQWLEQYQKKNQLPCEEVVTGEEKLIFHDPENIGRTTGMDFHTLTDAVEEDIRPCSQCFPTMAAYEETERKIIFQNL